MNAASPSVSPSLPQDSAGSGRRRWRLVTSKNQGRLAHSGLPALVARVLENRGVASNAEAKEFLGGKAVNLTPWQTLPNAERAIGLLSASIKEGTPIAVYGDFDVDGITATAILTEAIRDLGGTALPFIPNRERDGYGLHRAAIDSLADRGARVLVTCDCGTTSVSEIEHARSLGMETVVVDHHVPPDILPQASSLVNPKLAGAGVQPEYASGALAFRLAEALYEWALRDFPEDRYLELAALATVADMVPLRGENRELLRRGLAALAKTERPGLKALIDCAGVNAAKVSAETIGFSLAPRLNASGRLDDANLSLRLLMSQDRQEAAELAATVDQLNKQRQQITQEAEDLARRMTEGRGDTSLTLLGHEDLHQGVIGLVAARLVETYARPAVVYQRGLEESRASCRSIPDYDMLSGLESCSDLFLRFGGHRQAGGFTIRNDQLDELERRLLEHADAALSGLDLTPVLNIDAEWPLSDLRGQEIKWLGKLQPHGVGNPEALLLSRGVTVAEANKVGEGSRHLRLKLRSGNVVWPAIAFRWDGEAPSAGQPVDVVYSISQDRFGPGDAGGSLQLTVVDLAAVV